jgi:phospholipase B1
LAPFADNLNLFSNKQGNTDLTYFSYDCFHLSQKGQSVAANALWNNMLGEFVDL